MGEICARKKLLFFHIVLIVFFISFSYFIIPFSYGAYSKASPSSDGPTVNDGNLVALTLTEDLDFPTSIAFVGDNDILVTEKNTGNVMRIINGEIQEEPILDVDVATQIERGLLGIDVSTDTTSGKTYVFLFYTESGDGSDGSDVNDGVDPLGNRLYRYELVNGELTNPLLLLDLPADPIKEGRTDHNGGKVVIGPDKNVYVIVGEVGGHETQAQNIRDGPPPNGLGGILRVTQDGDIVPGESIFGDKLPLSIYYAMGIRNSFGIAFDPVTGNLWDTENGPSFGDEINMVYPGFNSGWALIQGFAEDNLQSGSSTKEDLVYFGTSRYSDPEFLWIDPIGITAIEFLNSDKLGMEYSNNMFVGDINNGNIYRFTLNDSRNSILLDQTFPGNLGLLRDNTVDVPGESDPLIFGQGFGGITDIRDSPDGYLYVLSYSGHLYKILPSS